MIALLKNNQQIVLSKIEPADFASLLHYLEQLSPSTKERFGPHPFDNDSITNIFSPSGACTGYIARDAATHELIAYAIIKTGCLEHDISRLQSYGINPSHTTDCTFAPSVADAWQGLGVGNQLLQYIIPDLQSQKISRIILLGGVQAGNLPAVNYYSRNGFTVIGQFSHHGENYDMLREIGPGDAEKLY